MSILSDPDHQRVSGHATAHVAINHETQCPHHALFPHFARFRQSISDAGGKFLVISHGADHPFSALMIS